MSEHTEAPWSVVADGPWICGPHGETVALAQPLQDTPTQYRANARLIAAAPELLEALKDLMLSCGALDGNPKSDNVAERCARAAIAKAEGRQ